MSSNVPRVLIDACVLVKSAVRDIFLDLSQTGLIHLHWTPEIFAEYAKNWGKVRLRQFERNLRMQDVPPLTAVLRQKKILELQADAWKQLDALEKMIPEWPVPGWVGLKDADSARVRSRLQVGEPGGVDEKDLHVALAALQLKAASLPSMDDEAADPAPETWLLTENLFDLPPVLMQRFGVWSLDQATALEALYELDAAGVMASIERTRSEWRRPPVSVQSMLELLADPSQVGSEYMRGEMSKFWSV